MSESPSTDRFAITQSESTSAEPSLLSKYAALREINAELVEALERVAVAIEEKEKREFLRETDLNPEAHCESITLQIKDARAIFDAVERARGCGDD